MGHTGCLGGHPGDNSYIDREVLRESDGRHGVKGVLKGRGKGKQKRKRRMRNTVHSSSFYILLESAETDSREDIFSQPIARDPYISSPSAEVSHRTITGVGFTSRQTCLFDRHCCNPVTVGASEATSVCKEQDFFNFLPASKTGAHLATLEPADTQATGPW